MVLLPSLIHEELDRERIVKGFGVPNAKRRFGGGCAARPASNGRKIGKLYGASIVAKTETVSEV